jgi:hypothetical protein
VSAHIHTMRSWCARTLVLVPVPLLLGWTLASGSHDRKLAQVSGQVISADRPCAGAIYFVPEDQGGTAAMGPLEADGTFQLYFNGLSGRRGALPGRYRLVVYSRVSGGTAARAGGKLGEPRATGVLVAVEPGWNHFRIDLH